MPSLTTVTIEPSSWAVELDGSSWAATLTPPAWSAEWEPDMADSQFVTSLENRVLTSRGPVDPTVLPGTVSFDDGVSWRPLTFLDTHLVTPRRGDPYWQSRWSVLVGPGAVTVPVGPRRTLWSVDATSVSGEKPVVDAGRITVTA